MDNSSNLNELKAFTNCFINTDTPGYDSIANDPKGVTHEALAVQSSIQMRWLVSGRMGSVGCGRNRNAKLEDDAGRRL